MCLNSDQVEESELGGWPHKQDLQHCQPSNQSTGNLNDLSSKNTHKLTNQEFLSGGWDGNIHVWDARKPHSVRKFRGPFIAGEGILTRRTRAFKLIL